MKFSYVTGHAKVIHSTFLRGVAVCKSGSVKVFLFTVRGEVFECADFIC